MTSNKKTIAEVLAECERRGCSLWIRRARRSTLRSSHAGWGMVTWVQSREDKMPRVLFCGGDNRRGVWTGRCPPGGTGRLWHLSDGCMKGGSLRSSTTRENDKGVITSDDGAVVVKIVVASNHYAACWFRRRSEIGLRSTWPTGSQLRVLPVHRRGLRALAAW